MTIYSQYSRIIGDSVTATYGWTVKCGHITAETILTGKLATLKAFKPGKIPACYETLTAGEWLHT